MRTNTLSVQLLGIGAFVIGLTVMLGWWLRQPTLVQILPQLVPMQFNTALAACLAGLSVLLPSRNLKYLGQIAALLGLMLSLLTLLQYPTGLNFGLDSLFLEPYITVKSPYPGRMALNTSIGFLLFFVAAAIAQWPKSTAQKVFLPTSLAAIACSLAMLSIFGYAVNLSAASGWAGLSQMAPHTALAIICSSAGLLLLLRPDATQRQPSQAWVIAVTAGIVLTLLLGIFWAVSFERDHMLTALESLESSHAKQLVRGLPSLGATIPALFVFLFIFALVLIFQFLKVSQQELMISDMAQLKVSTFNAMLDSLIVINQHGIIMEVNKAAADLFGYQQIELVGKNVSCLMPDPHRKNHDDYLKQYGKTGTRKVIGERRLLNGSKKNGDVFPIILQVSESEQFGKPMYVGVVHDLTEFARIEKQAQDHALLLNTTMNVSSSGFVVCDNKGFIVDINKSLADMIGVVYSDAIDCCLLDFLKGPGKKRIEEVFNWQEHQDRKDSFELRLHSSKSDAFWVMVTVGYVARLSMYVLQMVDITELKMLNSRLKDKNNLLQAVNNDLEKFAYVASHDLKAPLRGIRQTADWVVEDLGSVPEEVQENIDLMKSRINRMEALLADLLDYYRVGGQNQKPQTIQTQEFINGLFSLQSVTEGLRFLIESNVDELFIDKIAVEQVIRNLIDNAIKHHRSQVGFVRVIVNQTDSHYQFVVEDDGPGIAERHAQRIFDLFSTLRPRDEVEGSGMGLAVVKKIVERSGGSVELSTLEHLIQAGEDKVRCRFTVMWPLIKQDQLKIEQIDEVD